MAYTYDDKLDFAAALYCPARMIADQTGWSWELLIGQAIEETGVRPAGRYDIDLNRQPIR